jgi:hypothetical protein
MENTVQTLDEGTQKEVWEPYSETCGWPNCHEYFTATTEDWSRPSSWGELVVYLTSRGCYPDSGTARGFLCPKHTPALAELIRWGSRSLKKNPPSDEDGVWLELPALEGGDRIEVNLPPDLTEAFLDLLSSTWQGEIAMRQELSALKSRN